MIHRFKDLEIWKQSRLLCSRIYTITANFPDNEKFGLTNQLRRASVSIPSNIAEGSSRNSNKEFCRFLDFSLGSAYEIETQLRISSDLNFVESDQITPIILDLNNITKMILKFKKSLN